VTELAVDLRPRQVELLLSLVDHGDVAAAAAQTGVSARALTRSVRELERIAGEPLIAIEGESVTVKPSGERLLRSARRVMAAANRLGTTVRDDRQLLRVAHIPGADTLSTLLDAILAVKPQLRIEEHVAADARQLVDLHEHRIDVAVTSVTLSDNSSLRCQPLRWDPIVAVLPSETEPGARCDPRDEHVSAARYGNAWAAHDEALITYERMLGCRLNWVSVPLGGGQELSALLRAAGRRPAAGASSALGSAAGHGLPLVDDPGLRWHLVTRRDDQRPAVELFSRLARTIAGERGWLRTPTPTESGVR